MRNRTRAEAPPRRGRPRRPETRRRPPPRHSLGAVEGRESSMATGSFCLSNRLPAALLGVHTEPDMSCYQGCFLMACTHIRGAFDDVHLYRGVFHDVHRVTVVLGTVLHVLRLRPALPRLLHTCTPLPRCAGPLEGAVPRRAARARVRAQGHLPADSARRRVRRPLQGPGMAGHHFPWCWCTERPWGPLSSVWALRVPPKHS